MSLYESGDDVIQIDGKEAFDKFLSENQLALVEFQAPWCGHCKNLAPEFKKAATTLKSQGIALVAVDANEEKNKEIASEQGVQGFPTLKVWNKKFGTGMSDQDGGRTADAIVEFMQKENKPLVSEVASLAEVTGAKPSFVVVGNPEANASVKSVAASKKANVNFYWIAALDGHSEGSVLFVEDGTVAATAESGSDLSKFVSSHAQPVVGQLTPENYQFQMERGLEIFWFGLRITDSEAVKEIREGVKGFEGKQSFVWIDYEKFEGYLKQHLGCTEAKCGILVKEKEVKQRMADNGVTFGAEGIQAFLQADAAGTLKNFSKSQAEPAEPEENNVLVLTANNFERNVKGKNVFVFQQAPWCGHCKSSKPEYEKLKAALNRSDIVVAKFDATENDLSHPKVDVQGFPTFQLFKAGDYENPVVYNGGRDVESWSKFLTSQVPDSDAKQDL